MEPAYRPVSKNGVPVKTSGLEQLACLVGAVVEHHRRAHPVAAVAPHNRHIGPADAVVGEALVIRRHPGAPDLRLDVLPDGVIHHRAGNGRPHAETRRKVHRHIVLPAGNVKGIGVRLLKRDNPRVHPRHQRPQRQKIMFCPRCAGDL